MLCIQLAKHAWERRQKVEQLQKVWDIAELVRQNPAIDWPNVQRQAAQQGLSRVLHFLLALAVSLVGCQLPTEVTTSIGADRAALALAQQASHAEALSATARAPSRNPTWDILLRLWQLRFYLRSRERRRDKWRHIGRVLITMAFACRSR